jgi:hypothetical protein
MRAAVGRQENSDNRQSIASEFIPFVFPAPPVAKRIHPRLVLAVAGQAAAGLDDELRM